MGDPTPNQPDPSPTRTFSPSICRRCNALLTPGKGDFYIILVEAYAENSPLIISSQDLAKDHHQEMQAITEELNQYSEQELMDMVHRRFTFYLCRPSYRQWIENPTGQPAA